MKIESVPIESLVEFPDNPRKHNDLQITELAKSVKMFGQTRPVLVDEDNMILGGHALMIAMKRNGDAKINVYRLPGLTPSQKRKLVLSDNKLYELGTTDMDATLKLLFELDDFDIPGFDPLTCEELTKMPELVIEGYGKLDIESDGVDLVSNYETGVKAEDISGTKDVREYRAGDVTQRVTCPNCGKEFSVREHKV